MTRISNADHVLLLLNAQLDQLRRARLAGARGGPSAAGQKKQSSLDRVSHAALENQLGESDVARALIAAILTDEFGPAVANDAGFQGLVDTVLEALRAEDETAETLTAAIRQLSAP